MIYVLFCVDASWLPLHAGTLKHLTVTLAWLSGVVARLVGNTKQDTRHLILNDYDLVFVRLLQNSASVLIVTVSASLLRKNSFAFVSRYLFLFPVEAKGKKKETRASPSLDPPSYSDHITRYRLL